MGYSILYFKLLVSLAFLPLLRQLTTNPAHTVE